MDGSGCEPIIEGIGERVFSAEEASGESGLGYGDPEGSREERFLSPERKRTAVEAVRRNLGQDRVSERHICRVLGQSRSTQRYSHHASSDEAKLWE